MASAARSGKASYVDAETDFIGKNSRQLHLLQDRQGLVHPNATDAHRLLTCANTSRRNSKLQAYRDGPLVSGPSIQAVPRAPFDGLQSIQVTRSLILDRFPKAMH